jgi:hypothetical protein
VIIKAIQMADTFIEARQALGFPSRLFTRARNRLVVLYACFDKGTSPPRQRKVYRPRTKRLSHGHSRRSIDVGAPVNFEQFRTSHCVSALCLLKMI